MKLMFISAHPDDGDPRAGGLAARYVERGGEAMFVSITNGNAGHHTMQPDELARTRKEESRRAGEVIGATYVVLDHDDARLEPTLEVREEIIGLIREFAPDLLLCLRPYEYHADHRAAGRLVADASYLLTVPLVRPDVPYLRRMPVICYTPDWLEQPFPFRPDAIVEVDAYFEQKVRMLACHESQVFEWLPFNGGYADEVPDSEERRMSWFRERCEERFGRTAREYRDRLIDRYGPERGNEIDYAEAFQVCPYGRQPGREEMEELFGR